MKPAMLQHYLQVGTRTLAAAAVSLIWLAGCTTISPEPDIPMLSQEEVQMRAWERVNRLTRLLDGLRAPSGSGIADLVEDLQAAINRVGGVDASALESLDVAALIEQNPNYWRASLELTADDGLLAGLEGMLLASAGKLDAASDVLDFLRQGPLMPEALDRPIIEQDEEIFSWQTNPPNGDLFILRGVPAKDRWEPLKRLQAQFPDSPAVAWEVLRMRADLADIPLVGEPTDENMLGKILEAEPRAMESVEAWRPLWSGLVQARGEAGDAARRLTAKLLESNGTAPKLTEEDLAEMVADFDRIGLPGWALRAERMRRGERGGFAGEDVETLRLLLPQLIGDEAAEQILDTWEQRQNPQVAVFPAVSPPGGDERYPLDPVVAANYERMRRRATVMIEDRDGFPTRQAGAYRRRAQMERMLGNWANAQLDAQHATDDQPSELDELIESMQLAVATGDTGLTAQRIDEIRRKDRRLQRSSFTVGLAEVSLGRWLEAAEAFERGYASKDADPERRAFSALHAFGAAALAGEARDDLVEKALGLNDDEAWINRLLETLRGEQTAETLLALADEGGSFETIGRRCEAHFALAFAPGQTEAGRRRELEACAQTGRGDFIEYEFALLWLRLKSPEQWGIRPGDGALVVRDVPAMLESVRPEWERR